MLNESTIWKKIVADVKIMMHNSSDKQIVIAIPKSKDLEEALSEIIEEKGDHEPRVIDILKKLSEDDFVDLTQMSLEEVLLMGPLFFQKVLHTFVKAFISAWNQLSEEKLNLNSPEDVFNLFVKIELFGDEDIKKGEYQDLFIEEYLEDIIKVQDITKITQEEFEKTRDYLSNIIQKTKDSKNVSTFKVKTKSAGISFILTEMGFSPITADGCFNPEGTTYMLNLANLNYRN